MHSRVRAPGRGGGVSCFVILLRLLASPLVSVINGGQNKDSRKTCEKNQCLQVGWRALCQPTSCCIYLCLQDLFNLFSG